MMHETAGRPPIPAVPGNKILVGFRPDSVGKACPKNLSLERGCTSGFIDLVRELPEAMKPRRIATVNDGQPIEHDKAA